MPEEVKVQEAPKKKKYAHEGVDYNKKNELEKQGFIVDGIRVVKEDGEDKMVYDLVKGA